MLLRRHGSIGTTTPSAYQYECECCTHLVLRNPKKLNNKNEDTFEQSKRCLIKSPPNNKSQQLCLPSCLVSSAWIRALAGDFDVFFWFGRVFFGIALNTMLFRGFFGLRGCRLFSQTNLSTCLSRRQISKLCWSMFKRYVCQVSKANFVDVLQHLLLVFKS
jgi:hypothetical protein